MTSDVEPLLSDEEVRIYRLLSQGNRGKIVQMILGHPDHLISIAELKYMVGGERLTRGSLDELEEAGIIRAYSSSETTCDRDSPSKFYGFTKCGVRILDKYNYLSGLPAWRAFYDNTKKTELIRRHELAQRPELPEEVRSALNY